MKHTWQTGMLLTAAAALAASAGLAQTPAPATAPRARAAATVIAQNGPYLGIGVQDIDSERAKTLKLKEERGAEVSSVQPDSPASKAGIQVGDVILEFNGQAVQSQEQLVRMVRESVAGRPVKVVVWRNGASQTLTATPDNQHMTVFSGNGQWPFAVEMPNMTEFSRAMPSFDMPHIVTVMQNPTLGIEGESLGDEQQFAEFFGVKDGVLVKSVIANSAAERAGIKAGDVIVKIGDTHVGTSREVSAALRAARSKGTYTVTVVRNKKETTLTVTAERQNGRVMVIRRAVEC